MALRNTLMQSIAALGSYTSTCSFRTLTGALLTIQDRIASLDSTSDSEPGSSRVSLASDYQDKESIDDRTTSQVFSFVPGDDHISVHSSASQRPPTRARQRFHQVDNEKSLSSHQSLMEDETDNHDRKVGLRRFVKPTADWITLILSVINPAIAVCIIGLTADHLEWRTGRGSQEANSVTVVFERPNASFDLPLDKTRMMYLPYYYDNRFRATHALLFAGIICTVGGIIVATLSTINHRSEGRSVKLGRKPNTSRPKILLARLLFDVFMFAAVVIILIYIRELFQKYRYKPELDITAQWFRPAVPPRGQRDDVVRWYDSPAQYNFLTWNCIVQGHASDHKQHRFFQLCQEAIAARGLFAILVAFQAVLLGAHGWAWWQQKKTPWVRSSGSGSTERILPQGEDHSD